MADVNRFSLPTFGMGKINSWEDKKDAGIVPIPFPGEDSEKTLGIDTLGIIAYWNISGRITDTFREMQDTIAKIKSIMDGKQTSWQPFYSPFMNYTYSVSGTKYNRQGNIGKNTSVAAFTLTDSNASFLTWGIRKAHTAQGATISGDVVKNLLTGEIAEVTNVTENTLTINKDLFTSTNTPYAVSVHMACKLLSFNVRWELPGLNYVDYELSIMQVQE